VGYPRGAGGLVNIRGHVLKFYNLTHILVNVTGATAFDRAAYQAGRQGNSRRGGVRSKAGQNQPKFRFPLKEVRTDGKMGAVYSTKRAMASIRP